MSSILKALKKAEEGRAEARDTESWSRRFDSEDTIRRQAKRSWWLRAFAVVVCLTVLAGAGGWLFYGHRQLLKESAVRLVKTDSKPGQPEATAPPVRSEAESTVAQSPPSETQPPPSDSKATTGTSSSSSPSAKTASPRTESASPAVIPVRESVASPRPEERVSAAGTVGSSRTLETRGFRLEAIVWSKNPEGRFAVINGNIVRVGGSIGDASVTDIERDSVEIRSGDKTGELRFTHD